MYYDSIDRWAEKYEHTQKEYAFQANSAEEHKVWREKARKRLLEITGILDCEKTEANVRRIWREEGQFQAGDPGLDGSSEVQKGRDGDSPGKNQESAGSTEISKGFVREYWLMDTEPGIVMPFYLLCPLKPNGAGVLALHGHGGGKELMISKAGEPLTFAEELAAEGFLVFCPDERGSGERRERFEQGDSSQLVRGNSHRELAQIAISFGQSVIGLAVWDLMRLVDVAEETFGIQRGHLGCIGFSGGGQQALWLAALDERLAAAMTGGYFYGMKDSLLLLSNNCACNYVPFLWKTMDMGDIGAMVAPRALWIENGEEDPLSGYRKLENVYEQLAVTQKAYSLYHAEEKLFHQSYPGGHVWYGKGLKEFLVKELTG